MNRLKRSVGSTATWRAALTASAVLVLTGVHHVYGAILLKNVLFVGGAPASLLRSLFPPPRYEMPNDVFCELTFPIAYGLDARDLAAKTGAFFDAEGAYLQATGFLLAPSGRVVTAVYSTGLRLPGNPAPAETFPPTLAPTGACPHEPCGTV